MVRMLVASQLFQQRGPLSRAVLSSLHIRGSGVQVDDALMRWRWDGVEPAVTTVITVDPGTAMVKGSRYETRGSLPHVVKIKASELWAGAKEGIEVHIKFSNLGIIKWTTEGEVRNLSHWIEDKDLEVTLMKGEAVVEKTDKDNNIGDFVVRFTILPAAVDRSLLYAHRCTKCIKRQIRQVPATFLKENMIFFTFSHWLPLRSLYRVIKGHWQIVSMVFN